MIAPIFVSPHPYASIATAKLFCLFSGTNASIYVCGRIYTPKLFWDNDAVMNWTTKNSELRSIRVSTRIICGYSLFDLPLCRALARQRCDCSIREQGVYFLLILRVIFHEAVCTLPRNISAEMPVITRGFKNVFNLIVVADSEHWRWLSVGMC